MAETLLLAFEDSLRSEFGSDVRAIFRGEPTEDMTQAGKGLPWVAVIDRGGKESRTSEQRVVEETVEVWCEARGRDAANSLGTRIETLLDQDPPTLAVTGWSLTWQKPVDARLAKEGERLEDGEWRWRASLVWSVRMVRTRKT